MDVIHLPDRMQLPIQIKSNGTLLLGEGFCCDGHGDRPFRIVTHIHADHSRELEISSRKCRLVLMTGLTKQLLEVLKGMSLQKWLPMDYYREFEYRSELIRFHPANHVPGSAQVWFQNDQLSIGYTSDFKPPVEILKPQILVIESTYGDPSMVRGFRDQVESKLVELVELCLDRGLTVILGYHGKLQEVMQLLASKMSVPFVVPRKIFLCGLICSKYGMHLGELVMAETRYAQELMSSGECIVFDHVNSQLKYARMNANIIILSGQEFSAPVVQHSKNVYTVAFSDHGDFQQLMEYVALSNPDMVIVDDVAGYGHSLAQQIQAQLGIRSIVMP